MTVIAASQRSAGLRVLGAEEGWPELPAARFYAFAHPDNAVCTALIDIARQAGRKTRFAPSSASGLI